MDPSAPPPNYFGLLYGDRPAPDDLTELEYVTVKPCAALGDVVVHVRSRGCADALAERAAALAAQGDLRGALGCRGAEADLLRCTHSAAAGPVTRIDPSLFELLLGGSMPANLAGLEWIAVRGDRQRGMLAEVDPLKCAEALTSRAAELRKESQADLSAAQRCADMAMRIAGASARGKRKSARRAIVRAAEERCRVLHDLLLDAEAQWVKLSAGDTSYPPTRAQQPATIFVEMPSGRTESFPVRKWYNVDCLEAQISERGFGSSHRLVLGNELESRRLLRDYCIADRTTLRLVPTIPIHVKDLTAKYLKFHVPEEETVQSLKVRLRERDGIPPDQQRLIAFGRQMEDGRQLRDYGIRSGGVVHSVLRLRGS